MFEGHPIGSRQQKAQDDLNRRFDHIKADNVVSQTLYQFYEVRSHYVNTR